MEINVTKTQKGAAVKYVYALNGSTVKTSKRLYTHAAICTDGTHTTAIGFGNPDSCAAAIKFHTAHYEAEGLQFSVVKINEQ